MLEITRPSLPPRWVPIFRIAKTCTILFFLSVIFACQSTQPNYHASSISYATEGKFEDVKEDLIMSIEAQGAVISYTAHSSAMLNRTAITLEMENQIYDKAEIVLFCKAELSHKMVQADPHSLVLCPYPISIYTLSNEPETVYITIRKPPREPKEYGAVHLLLTKIILEAIEE
ncbi:MAG: DUF302 domain-containing protein [Kangiellaceae bacterium]|nr:DUF302 domain-containing protein [Kangiellaceae bacterium]